MKTDWNKLAACVVLCELAGIVGSLATLPAIPTWYAALAKPEFAPPNWVFGPAWTLLYLLMGVALYFVWMKGLEKPGVKKSVGVFGLQLLLNVAWSFLFFGLKSPLLGLFGIVLLAGAIARTIREFYAVSRPAGWLLVPYLAWTLFATLLNYSVLKMNP